MIRATAYDETGAKVRWQDWGEGAPLLLLPGLSFPVALNLGEVAAHPALAHRRKILIDYPGSGWSDWREDGQYSLELHARACLAVIEELGSGAVDIVGHSMGGTVAILAAFERPGLVGRIVVAEANVEPGGGGASLAVARQGREEFVSSGFPKMLERLLADDDPGYGPPLRYAAWRDADPVAFFENAAGLVDLRGDFFERYAGLPMPRAFIYGGRNTGHVTPDTPDPARLEAAGIRAFTVADAGHAMMFDNLAGFMEAVAEALDMGAGQT